MFGSPSRCRKPAYCTKKNVLSFLMGPPNVAAEFVPPERRDPAGDSRPVAKKLRASKALFRRNSNRLP